MAIDRRYMILNGELLSWQHLDGAYIYQNIHTLDYAPRHVKRHAEMLRTLSQELFGVECSLSAEGLESQIRQLLEHVRPSRQRSIRVVAKQYSSGDYSIECDEPSLYRGYTLRSLRPEAATLRVAMPLDIYPTSAAIATRCVADSIARSRDFHQAILLGEDREILSEASAPIALVRGRTLTIAPAPYSVEREIVEQAAARANIAVERKAFTHEEMMLADEVIVISWQGITAMQSVDNRTFMSIIAEHLAREMEKL